MPSRQLGMSPPSCHLINSIRFSLAIVKSNCRSCFFTPFTSLSNRLTISSRFEVRVRRFAFKGSLCLFGLLGQKENAYLAKMMWLVLLKPTNLEMSGMQLPSSFLLIHLALDTSLFYPRRVRRGGRVEPGARDLNMICWI